MLGVGRSCLSVHYWDVCDLHVNASNFFRTQCMVNVVIAEHIHATPIMPHSREVNGSPSSIGRIPQFYPLLVSLLLGCRQGLDTFTPVAALTSVFDFPTKGNRHTASTYEDTIRTPSLCLRIKGQDVQGPFSPRRGHDLLIEKC